MTPEPERPTDIVDEMVRHIRAHADSGVPVRGSQERRSVRAEQLREWADTVERLRAPSAGGEPRFGDPCPHCDKGEIHVPSSVPGDEGWQTCPTCSGSERLPTVDEFREWKIKAEAAMGDLVVAEAEITAIRAGASPGGDVEDVLTVMESFVDADLESGYDTITRDTLLRWVGRIRAALRARREPSEEFASDEDGLRQRSEAWLAIVEVLKSMGLLNHRRGEKLTGVQRAVSFVESLARAASQEER